MFSLQKQEKQQQVRRLDHLRGMSSGAKRFVQSLRGRNVTTSNNSSSNNNNNNNNNSGSSHHLHQHHRSGSGSSHDIGGGGGASASTSATRLFDRYDSGHELDEISVIGRSGPDDYTAAATTPTTPYHQQQQQQQLHHHYSSGGAAPISPAATVIGGSSLGSVGLNKQYDSRQTLYSIAGSMPNSQASGAASNNRLITPAGEFSHRRDIIRIIMDVYDSNKFPFQRLFVPNEIQQRDSIILDLYKNLSQIYGEN
ncbi:hypothetical protein TKK_0004023 [Trichogramma kaykai]